MASKNDNSTGLINCVLFVGIVGVLYYMIWTKPNPGSGSGPAPYQAGQPGFDALDKHNYNSDGTRASNEDKAIMKDAINKFEACDDPQ